MPTILTHTAVPLAIGLALGPRVVSRSLLVAGVLASMLPDLEASPLSLRRVFSARGAAVLGSELLWVWLPAMALAAVAVLARRVRRV